MNRLKRDKQKMILNLLVEGCSIRSIERITGVHRDTIGRLMERVGNKCQEIMDEKMQNLHCNYLEADEIYGYVYKKQQRIKDGENPKEIGDQYVFIALDRDTKLIPVFKVGKRNRETTTSFLLELQKRVTNHFQLTTDQFHAYYHGILRIFGTYIDYAALRKVYDPEDENKRAGYSPRRLRKTIIGKIIGNPEIQKICTSYVERQNLTIRTQVKRFTRLTNAYSKKLSRMVSALSLHFWHYNFMRVHTTLKTTPAIAAGIASKSLTWEEILD